MEKNDLIVPAAHSGARQPTWNSRIESGRVAAMPPRLAFDLITGPVLAAFHTLQTEAVPEDYPQQMALAVLTALGVPRAAAAKAASLPLPPLQLPADALLVRAQARAALSEA